MENFSKKLVEYCISRGLSMSIAESCTGGMLALAITSVSGASKIFDLGLITYSNSAKISVLKVNKKISQKYLKLLNF